MADATTKERCISDDLKRAEKVILKLEKKHQILNKAKFLTKIQKETLNNEMMAVLLFLGDISEAGGMTDLREKTEEQARKENPKNFKKARKQFLKEYTDSTLTVDKLKERCWRLIDKIGKKK